MKKNKTLQLRIPFRQRVILLLFGISLCFVLLEMGLRLGGLVILSLQEHRNRATFKQKGAYRIMCLGESTTQGGWPHFFEEILNQRKIGMNFSVIDKGVSGTNTGIIVSQLEVNLDKYHPDMVVTMMGINDKGEHIPYERPTLSKTILFIRSFRTYKLARLLWLHMVTKAKEIGLYKLHGDKPSAQERESSLLNIRSEETNAQQKDNIKNEDLLKKALELDPWNGAAYFGFGDLYQNQGQFQQAEDFFKKALELDPGNIRAYIELGTLYRDQGKFQQAEDACKKALELNPENIRAYIKLGRLYQAQRKFQQAEDTYKKALELDPENIRVYIELGTLYRNQGKFQQAEDACKKALELDPWNSAVYLGFGRLYQDQGEFQQAEDAYKKALELNPGNSGVYIELGTLYRNQGKFQQAEDTYKKALELNPGEVVSAKLYGALGVTYDEMGQFTLAEECYSRENQIRLSIYNPTTVYNYHKLKEILAQKGIKLVCVQYPMLNIEPLKKIFQGDIDGIFFVDNEKTFKEAVKKGSYKMYFIDMFGGDFGHCTREGNRLIAENAAKVILKEVFHK